MLVTLKDIFSGRGYDVVVTERGKEAETLIREKSFHAAMIDINLPDMNGMDLLFNLKSIEPDLICFIITGHASMKTAIMAIQAGATDYFTKPLVMQQLENRLEEALKLQEAQRALKESEEIYRLVTETAHDAIIMINSEGKVTFWNPAAENIFGYTRDEIIGRDLHELIIPEKYRKDVKNAFLDFQETGTGTAIAKTTEMTAQRKGGQTFRAEVSLSAIRKDNSWHTVGIVRDISKKVTLQLP